MTVETILTAMLVTAGLTVVLAFQIFINRKVNLHRQRLRDSADAFFIERYFNDSSKELPIPKRFFLESYMRFSEQEVMTAELKQRILSDFQRFGIIEKHIRMLESRFIYRRKRAIVCLGYFTNSRIKEKLLEALKKEKREHVKIYILNSLKNKIDQYVLNSIIDSIVGSRRFYQQRVIGILQKYLVQVEAHLQNIFRRPEMEIKEVFVDLTNVYYRPEFKQVLIEELAGIEEYFSGSEHPTFSTLRKARVMRLYYAVLSALGNVYDTPLDDGKYLDHSDLEVVRIATKSFVNFGDFSAVTTLLEYADGSEKDEIRAHTIIRILENNQSLLNETLSLVTSSTDPDRKALLAHVLSHKIEYLMLKLLYQNRPMLKQLLELMVEHDFTADLIQFLNQNTDLNINDILRELLQPMTVSYPKFALEMSEYLREDLLKSYDLKPQKKKKSDKPSGPPEVRKTRWLIMQLIIAILSLPILFVLLKGFSLKGLSDREIFIEYILSLNRWFIVYYLVVNFLYLTLALFSAIGSGRNRRNWALKKQGFLFEPHALPSISIIAPAYNEELSIVDSVESLLNLNYPSIEVIVVNDGSADGTLEKLINHFNLERENLTDKSAIPTRPVRAIYRNKFIDSLLVIDKENGGKADALNVGINYANSEYVCGIDADSLLEKDSLLILMSSILDSDRITLALGGAVVPVNGCTVDHGQIESHRMPRSWLARFQTIEYLRAFNVSRTGFAHLRSLLIVSGAFGVFEKRILTEVGGYLTVSSLKKDTVGEDMELVVRITRKAYEEKLNFRIDYVDIARCYTEVPEERKSFFRQRNRWQRGLVDILSYHRSLIFNPRYGRVGFLGMPYFYLFEMIGPLFEVQAYLAIILGFVFGLLNIEIVLLLLFVTVVLGMFVSMLSLCISERRSTSYRLKDLLMLVFIAIVENFGWRQLISLYRVKGFIVSFRENNVWGQMNRVGFKK